MRKTMYNRRKESKDMRFLLFLLSLVLSVIALLKYTDDKVMPSVLKMMESHGENISIKAIDGAVKTVIGRSGITTSDLYVKTTGKDGRLMSLSANTLLINNLCADVAEEVVKNIEQMEDETVFLPLGIITGIDFLSTKGPPVFKVTVKPMGRCSVDYKTSFKSEGINQVNYQIWLEIKTGVAVVNPALSESVAVSRNIPIVNTYIGGDVPESMLYPFKTNEKLDVSN